MKVTNQACCFTWVLLSEIFVVSCSNEFYNYFHNFHHYYKRRSTSVAPSSSTRGLPTPETSSSSSSSVKFGIPTDETTPDFDSESFTEENRIFVTQNSYSEDYNYQEKLKWLIIARVVAITGGIFLFVSLICCIGFCCGGFRKDRPNLVVGNSTQSLVPQTQQLPFENHTPSFENMQPPPPPYSEEKSQLHFQQDGIFYTHQTEQQSQYSFNQYSTNFHNPPTAPPPYEERY